MAFTFTRRLMGTQCRSAVLKFLTVKTLGTTIRIKWNRITTVGDQW